MKNVTYDPAEGRKFWDEIRKLPGFPMNETMPIREMIFESNALFKTSGILKSIGGRQDMPLVVVMDETTMQRNQENLKELLVEYLQTEGWQVQVTWMRGD